MEICSEAGSCGVAEYTWSNRPWISVVRQGAVGYRSIQGLTDHGQTECDSQDEVYMTLGTHFSFLCQFIIRSDLIEITDNFTKNSLHIISG